MTINKGIQRITKKQPGKLYEVTIAWVYYNDLTNTIYICKQFMGMGSFQYACCFMKEYNLTHKGNEQIKEFKNINKAEQYLNSIIN